VCASHDGADEARVRLRPTYVVVNIERNPLHTK
jgi:hypothetical protein